MPRPSISQATAGLFTVEEEDAVASTLSWMSIQTADFLLQTEDLSAEEGWSLIRLVMLMYQRDGWLPFDHRRLAKLAGVPPAEWPPIWEGIARFFVIEGDRLTSELVGPALERARKLSEQQAKKAAKRWGSKSGNGGGDAAGHAARHAAAMPEHMPRSCQGEGTLSSLRSESAPRAHAHETPISISRPACRSSARS